MSSAAGNGFETNEMMALALSRHLADGEIGFIGVGSSGRAHELVTAIPMMAAHLANGRGVDFDLQIGPLIAPDLERPPSSWFDNEIYGWTSPALIPSDVNMDGFLRGAVSVGFISGAQIDRWGNVNVSKIRGKDGTWKRLGGALALPEHCAFAGRAVLLCDLSERTFVEEVDYVTGFGHRRGEVTRDDLGLPGGGPALVVTDLAVFDFEGGEMRLAELYPGVEVEEVEARMGFIPARAADLAELEPPSSDQAERLDGLRLPALPY
jgi:glutaconate CoA-transferase subunit B